MANPTPDSSRFNWMLPLCAALVVVAIYISMWLWAADAEFFASLLLIAPILIALSVVLIAYAIIRKDRQRRLTFFSTVAAMWVAALLMFWLSPDYDFAVRTNARWLIWSTQYKARVLAQPTSTNGDFKHIEWDGWGFVPAGNTTVYLVFDPSDSLSSAAKSRRSGKYVRIPCAVPAVNRLEKNWHTVLFNTDQDWNHCN